jgi:hypothetical protein
MFIAIHRGHWRRWVRRRKVIHFFFVFFFFL